MNLRSSIMLLSVMFAVSLAAEEKPAPSPWLLFDKLASVYPDEGKQIEEMRSKDPAAAAAKLDKLIQDDEERRKSERRDLDRAARAAASDEKKLPEFRLLAGKYYDKLVREREQYVKYLEKRLLELKEKNVSPGVFAREERNLNMVRSRKIAKASSREEYIEARVRAAAEKKRPPKKHRLPVPKRDEEK